jgi:hypothetical protein
MNPAHRVLILDDNAVHRRMAPVVFQKLSCQFLAQNTHPYTSLEKGRKALLERLRQGM